MYAATLARRQGLRDRGRRLAGALFFDPDEKYIWALAVDASGRAVGRRRQSRGDLSRRADRHSARSSTSPPRRTSSRSPRRQRPDAGRHRVAWAAVSLRGRRSAVRAARLRHDRTAGGRPRTATASSSPPPSPRGDDSAPASGETTSVGRHAAAADAGIGSGRRRLQRSTSTPPARRSVLYRIDPSGTWEPVWETSDVDLRPRRGRRRRRACGDGPRGPALPRRTRARGPAAHRASTPSRSRASRRRPKAGARVRRSRPPIRAASSASAPAISANATYFSSSSRHRRASRPGD